VELLEFSSGLDLNGDGCVFGQDTEECNRLAHTGADQLKGLVLELYNDVMAKYNKIEDGLTADR
jgi:hypothetical protein